MSEPVNLQIGDVAKKAGVSLRTVRYYEELGLLRPRVRTSCGTRLYGDAEVVRLRFIRRLRTLGLNLEEITAALGLNHPAQGRKERVARTLDVLLLEQRRAEEQMDVLARLREEVEGALESVRKCATCTREECVESCPPRAHLL